MSASLFQLRKRQGEHKSSHRGFASPAVAMATSSTSRGQVPSEGRVDFFFLSFLEVEDRHRCW